MPPKRITKRRASASKRSPLKRKAKSSFVPGEFLSSFGEGRTIIKYRNKQKLFSQGDAADSVYFVQKGRVKITTVSAFGREAIVAILDKGELCGEACLSGQRQRVATARAMEDCEITRIEKTVLVRTLRNEPSLASLFLEYMLKRTIRVEADLADQLSNTSEKRLARALLMMANGGRDSRPEPIVGKISQVTLAEMIGTTRSRVSSFMNKFRKMGFISYNGSQIEIHGSLLNVVLKESPHSEAGVELSKGARRSGLI